MLDGFRDSRYNVLSIGYSVLSLMFNGGAIMNHLIIRTSRWLRLAAFVAGLSTSLAVLAQQPPTRDEASAALKKAVTFFREKVSAEGGYLWRYSEDLSLREGEEKATETIGW